MATHSFPCLEKLKDTGAWRATVRGVRVRGQNEHMSACAAQPRTHTRVHALLFPPFSLSSGKEAQPPSASPQRATQCLLKMYAASIFQRTQPSRRPRKKPLLSRQKAILARNPRAVTIPSVTQRGSVCTRYRARAEVF